MKLFCLSATACLVLCGLDAAEAGALVGHVRDPNWFARRADTDPYGVGVYEYAVNANGHNLTTLGGQAATGVFGEFDMQGLPAGTYTVASWDTWWRSAFAFNVTVPASGATPDVDVRLRATMWGYPAFWDDTAYHEFGQTFVASGPVTMIYLRNPLRPSPTFTLTVHSAGPGGPQIGQARSFNDYWDVRLIYGYGEMPTVTGQTYYVRLRTDAPAAKGILCQMDPRPEDSDPMPGGCLHLGDGTTLTAHPDRDLGLVIMADDDGLITNLKTRRSGDNVNNVTSVGQTFLARGVGLISAALWLADGTDPAYVVRVLQSGPAGPQVGPPKRGRPARRSADPEMLVLWAPGECPLTPGQTYYLEVTRDGGGAFNDVFVNRYNPFPHGQAYQNGGALAGTDLAGTIMEEESPGSATMPEIQILNGPDVLERGSNYLRLRWNTSVAADSLVEYAIGAPPYTQSHYEATAIPLHNVTLTGLQPHRLYHFRVHSRAAGYRPAVSRDVVVSTLPASPNLLTNPGFEEGSGAGPSRPVTGWTVGGGLDLKAADGSWFGGLPPRSGAWLLEGAVNAGNSDGYAFQRVTGIAAGREYTFSSWVRTDHRENGTWKYDVWDRRDRLICIQLGLDPTGGTDPNAGTVQWTPRAYSHRQYANLARTATAQGAALTVFIRFQGAGGDWHLYGVDDCVLTQIHAEIAQHFESLPTWATAYNDADGVHAQWASVPGGPEGNALLVTNAGGGTSVRVLTLPVEPNTHYLASIQARCPPGASEYVADCALKAGYQVALNHALFPDSWMALKRFSRPGLNGNGDSWTQYQRPIFSGANTQMSVAFRLKSTAGPSPAVQWDTLRLDPETPVLTPLIALDAQTQWRYEQSGTDLGTAWRLPDFDDSGWLAGPALLAAEDCNCLPEDIRTPLAVAPETTTFYFRHRFALPASLTRATLRLRPVVDDGVVYYLNGSEIFRLGVTNQPVGFGDLAARTVGNASYEGPFDLTVTNLLPGDNLLGAEVHQASADSSDVVFGVSLDALILPHQAPITNALLNLERQGDLLVLYWGEPSMTVETSKALAGPWTPTPGQNAPVLLGLTNAARFFRLRQ